MTEGSGPGRGRREREFLRSAGAKAARRRRHRRNPERSTWSWLGMFGLVGWAVAVPALCGVAIGWWIDRRWDTPASWTLNLLVVGIVLGCWNAWRWVEQEGHRSEGDERE